MVCSYVHSCVQWCAVVCSGVQWRLRLKAGGVQEGREMRKRESAQRGRQLEQCARLDERGREQHREHGGRVQVRCATARLRALREPHRRRERRRRVLRAHLAVQLE